MLTVLPTPASPFAMLPGETPQDAAARLDLPCETVQTAAGSVIVVGRVSPEQVQAAHRHILRLLRECEPLAAPAPVPEAVTV